MSLGVAQHHNAPITSIEWSPHDSSCIAVSGADDQVRTVLALISTIGSKDPVHWPSEALMLLGILGHAGTGDNLGHVGGARCGG